MKKLSIVITCYKQEENVGRILRTIDADGSDGVEVAVVDDQGTTCRSVLADRKEKFMLFVNLENRGVGYSRNSGAFLTTGEWVWFVDGDDELEPSAVSRVLKRIEEAGPTTDAIALPFVRLGRPGESPQECVYSKADRLRSVDLPVMPWAKVLRRGNFPRFRECSALEDTDWWFRTCLSIRGIELMTGSPVYRYHYATPGSQTAIVSHLFDNANDEMPRKLADIIAEGNDILNGIVAAELRTIAEMVDIRGKTDDADIRAVVDWWIRRNLKVFVN